MPNSDRSELGGRRESSVTPPREPLPIRFVITRPHSTRAMVSLPPDRRAFNNNIQRGRPMEIGYFTMPSHPPECGLKEGHDWDLQTLRWLDELGYQEAWIGEHHTAPWEPHPSPDLILAQAFL